MTTHELLEMVSLDALGLLDDEEREDFERAFRAAPPTVQAQIRREQARLARTEVFLPSADIEPPPGLRARVVAAVREAMQSVSARRRDAGALLPFPGVARVWRTVAIGCAAAAMVFAVTTLYMKNQFADLAGQRATGAQLEQWVQEFGTRFRDAIMDPTTTFVSFKPEAAVASASGKVGALLLLEGDQTSGQLILNNLPADAGTCSLHVVDKDGNILGDAVVTFRATEPFTRFKGLRLNPGQSFAIVAPGTGDKPTTMLRSTRS